MRLTTTARCLLIFSLLVSLTGWCQGVSSQSEIDQKVKAFLSKNKSNWQDLNVPYEDGQVLYDLIIKNNYKAALEIGTSTGHSTIWIAWALLKTGGKLVTIEIDENRHKQAIENLKKVGLLDFVDARLADAHTLVKELPGPFDFIFSDADKTWYTTYFKDIEPKLSIGGCFTAHNVNNHFSGIPEYMAYVKSRKNFETTIVGSKSEGIAVSYKRAQ